MKIEQKTATVQSTMGGENVAMGIRTEDMMHIMGVLDGLYSDRLKAVLREYSTNAWDAHVDAGFSGAIEVSLPSNLHPYLSIRDYGEGLDRDGIREVYSQYGRSTKRDSNEVTGMLGLGSKSALAYNSRQFTVASIKNGVKITVLVSKNEEGMGVMSILGEQPTDEASGTTITIGIARDDLYRIAQVADHFYSFWEPGTVTVDSRQPRYFADYALKLADDLYLIEGHVDRQDYVVMGNVAYPQRLDVGVQRGSGYNGLDFGLVYVVPIGSVMPAPSREALKDVKSTKDTLALAQDKYTAGIKHAVQAEIDSAKSPQEAIKLALKWIEYSPVKRFSQFTYNGNPMPTEYEPAAVLPDYSGQQYGRSGDVYEDGRYVAPRIEMNPLNSGKKSSITRRRAIPVSMWPTLVWVQGFDVKGFNATHHNKLKAYCQQHGIGWDPTTLQRYSRLNDGHVTDFVLCRDNGPVSPFIDSKRYIKWEDVKKIKLTPTTTGYYPTKSIPGSYSVYTEMGYTDEKPGSDLRTNEPMFYKHGNRWECDFYNDMLKQLYPKYTLVCLPGNRVKKFERDVPKAIPVAQGIKDEFKKWSKTVSKKDLKALAMQDRGFKSALASLDETQVEDPALKADILIAKRDIKGLTTARNAFRSLVDTGELDVAVTNPLNAFLLSIRDSSKPDAQKHFYAYINLVYKGI